MGLHAGASSVAKGAKSRYRRALHVQIGDDEAGNRAGERKQSGIPTDAAIWAELDLGVIYGRADDGEVCIHKVEEAIELMRRRPGSVRGESYRGRHNASTINSFAWHEYGEDESIAYLPKEATQVV
ncbi:hypothetical protein MMC30_001645 [Trapelia coarctata]|nr:hypothetical protein [Trapelia coarctata]